MKVTLQEKAYHGIISKIINGELKFGNRIREQHIAKELQISATPVREAFRRLELEAWVEMVPQKGVRLKKYEKDDIRDLYVLRESIETISLVLILERATEEDWDSIKEAIDEYERDCDQCIDHYTKSQKELNDIECPIRSDAKIHEMLIKATHSQRIIQLANSMNLQAQSMVFAGTCSVTVKVSQLKQSCKEHSALYDALRRGQLRLAEELVRAHISSAWKHIEYSFKDDRDD